MRNSKWLIVAVIVLVCMAAGWLWWRSDSSDSAKKDLKEKLMPTVGVTSVNITDIDKERITMKSKVMLSNPFPVEIATKRLDYKIYIDSIKVMEDAYSQPITIRSQDSTEIEIPMQLLSKNMAEVLKYFDDHKIDSADYAVDASFEAEVPVAGEKRFTLHLAKKLPAVRIPKIKIKDIDIHPLRIKDKGVDVVVQVANPNQFPLKMQDGTFYFGMEDDMKMEGKMEKTVSIAPGGAQDVSIHLDLIEAKILKAGWELLTDKADTKFTVKFKCKMMSDNPMLNNSKMNMNMNGTLEELLEAAKEIK
jgi:LEA14-like dessication related protein